LDHTTIEAIRDLAIEAQGPHHVGGHPIMAVPSDHKIVNLESYLEAPLRKAGTTTLRDAASFIALVNEQKNGSTKLFGQFDPPAFTAVFNAHAAAPGWGDHKASYACPLSVEWKRWMGSNTKQMNQADFAQFIEDNLPDICSPSSAEILEVSRTLEAKKAVQFGSSIRLSDGQNQFTYEETIEGTSAKGQMRIPEFFLIAIPVFEGSTTANQIKARLRYRINNERKLVMWYDLERPHKDLEAAVRDVWAEIAGKTELFIFNGT